MFECPKCKQETDELIGCVVLEEMVCPGCCFEACSEEHEAELFRDSLFEDS
jgi:hypothetical protein